MKILKRLGTFLFLALFSALPVLTINQTKVSALANEKLSALYINRRGALSVDITGNGLADRDSLPLNTSLTSTSNGITYSNYLYPYTLYSKDQKEDPSKQCTISLKMVVGSNTPSRGTMYVSTGSQASYSNSDRSYSINPCSNSILDEAKNKFDQKGITLGNIDVYNAFIGTGGEQPNDKVVQGTAEPLIDAESFDKIDESKVPAQDTIRLKSADGKKELQKQTVKDSISQNPTSVGYFFTFSNVGAGSYEVCSDLLKKCEAFTKEPGVAKTVNIQGDEDTKLLVKDPTKASDDSCESKSGDWGWLVCAGVRMVGSTLSWVEQQITSLLNVDGSYSDNPKMQQAWSNIRNIAYLILLPMMLIMVISTSLGFDFVSAYTIKKALPRMVAAVIFIALSYSICVFLIGLFNIIGHGVYGLMTAPFGVDKLASLFNTHLVENFLGTVGGVIAAIIFFWLFGGTLLLFAGIGFLVLLLRQMLIVLAIIISPLAILAWVFPGGNHKLWKYWHETFIGMLMMFPLVFGVIAVGHILAVIIHDSSAAPPLRSIMVLSAWMLPYAFIPFAFKIAGGLFSAVTGMVNDKSKGLFDRQRQKRGENWSGFKAGSKAPPGLRGKNFAAKGMQRIGTGIGAGVKGRAGFGKRGEIVRSANQRAYGANMMKDPLFQQIQHDDEAMRAATYGSAAEARNAGINDDAIKKVQSTIGFGQGQQVAAAQQMLLNKTAYRDAGDVARTIARVSGGNSDMAQSLRGFNNAYAKQVGRHDISAISTAAVDHAGAELAAGSVSDGSAYSAELHSEGRRNTMTGFENADTYTLGKENGTSFTNMAIANSEEYYDAVQAHAGVSADPAATMVQRVAARDRVVQSRTRLEETMKNLNGATGVNARVGTRTARLIQDVDAQFRTLDPATADQVLGTPGTQGEAMGSVGTGGLARAQGDLTRAQREALERSGGAPNPFGDDE